MPSSLPWPFAWPPPRAPPQSASGLVSTPRGTCPSLHARAGDYRVETSKSGATKMFVIGTSPGCHAGLCVFWDSGFLYVSAIDVLHTHTHTPKSVAQLVLQTLCRMYPEAHRMLMPINKRRLTSLWCATSSRTCLANSVSCCSPVIQLCTRYTFISSTLYDAWTARV